jgi:uncharacterized protein YggT (Ycf19 family)
MQQNPNYNPNSGNQDPQNPQGNPSNQTFVNATPVNNTPQNTNAKTNGTEKIIQLVWFVVGFINVILIIRIIFLLFSARSSGFTGFLYNITSPFVSPFVGIFPVPGQANTFFDTAALVAIIIYSLATWGIVTLIRIMSNQKTA